MQQKKPQAVYILNRRVFKETSLLLDVFSYEFGRQSVVAKGAMKNNKGWAALLQVFQPLLMIWTGRSTLKTLVSVEAPSAPFSLRNERLYSGFYLNELLIKLVSASKEGDTQTIPVNSGQNDLYHSLFLRYAAAIEGLQHHSNIEIPIRIFEYHLLNELGIFPDCSVDLESLPIQTDRYYQFILREGFLALAEKDLPDKNVHAVLSGHTLQQLTTQLDQLESLEQTAQIKCLRELKYLMRVLIHDALGGKEIKSRALFQPNQANRSSS